jgi:hypothetical protein
METNGDKEARIAELEALVASLRRQLKAARDTIASLQQSASRRYRDAHDYLPYEEDDRR